MSRAKGNIGEHKGVLFLEENNFKIIDRNFNTTFGEIDIIATKDGVLHFVEVKSGEDFEPVFNITKQKISKIIKSIQIYLQKNNSNIPYCLDVLIVKGDSVEMLENITM